MSGSVQGHRGRVFAADGRMGRTARATKPPRPLAGVTGGWGTGVANVAWGSGDKDAGVYGSGDAANGAGLAAGHSPRGLPPCRAGDERVLLPPGEPENSINRRRADRANPLPVAALALPGECGEPHVAPGE